jgi:hypothetical protein
MKRISFAQTGNDPITLAVFDQKKLYKAVGND